MGVSLRAARVSGWAGGWVGHDDGSRGVHIVVVVIISYLSPCCCHLMCVHF